MLAMGSILSILSWPFKAAGNSFLSVLASAIENACLSIVKTMSTFWINVPTPNLTTGSGGGPSTTVAFLQGHLAWYVGACCFLSIIIGVFRMIWEQRGGHHAAELFKGLLVQIAVQAAALTVIAMLLDASDQFANWILAASLNVPADQLGNAVTKGMSNILVLNDPGGAVFLSILLGLFGMLGAIVQVFLMVIRGGMLVLLTGVLPWTFSLWTTETGKQMSKKASSWILAFILYKPAAAIIYGTAFMMLGSGAQAGSIDTVLTGMALMGMAVVALPALMRFVSPAVSAIAAGGAGMMLGVAGAAAGAAMLPTGAANLAARGAGSAASGAPTGAASTGASDPTPPPGGGASSSAGGGAGQAASGGSAATGAVVATGGAAAPAMAAVGAAQAAAGAAEQATEQSSGQGDQL
jgi:type IV secretion system protein TrbL